GLAQTLTWIFFSNSPAVRLAVEDAHIGELLLDEGLPFLGGGRQRRAGWPHRAAHDHHATLERGWILVFEQVPEPRHLVLQLACARPLARHAGLEQRGAQVRADRARGRV